MAKQKIKVISKEKISKQSVSAIFEKLQERHLDVFEETITLRIIQIYAKGKQVRLDVKIHYLSEEDITLINDYCKNKKFEMYNYSIHPHNSSSLHVTFSFSIKHEYLEIVYL